MTGGIGENDDIEPFFVEDFEDGLPTGFAEMGWEEPAVANDHAKRRSLHVLVLPGQLRGMRIMAQDGINAATEEGVLERGADSCNWFGRVGDSDAARA